MEIVAHRQELLEYEDYWLLWVEGGRTVAYVHWCQHQIHRVIENETSCRIVSVPWIWKKIGRRNEDEPTLYVMMLLQVSSIVIYALKGMGNDGTVNIVWTWNNIRSNLKSQTSNVHCLSETKFGNLPLYNLQLVPGCRKSHRWLRGGTSSFHCWCETS